VVVAAGLQNPWTARRKVELAELVDEPWTLPPHYTFVTSIAIAAFRASGLSPPRATVIAQSLYVRNRLLETGRFLTVIGSFALAPPGKHPSLKTVPVELPNAGGAISLVTLKNRTLSPLAELFIDTFRAVVKPLARGR
jgi:DNA-binding transcriptional LysR family regulator